MHHTRLCYTKLKEIHELELNTIAICHPTNLNELK